MLKTEALKRAMSRRDLVAVAINSEAGAGVPGLPGRMFAALGDFSVIAWALCALVFGLIALCFAEVARRFAATGGVYLSAHATLGPNVGFLVVRSRVIRLRASVRASARSGVPLCAYGRGC